MHLQLSKNQVQISFLDFNLLFLADWAEIFCGLSVIRNFFPRATPGPSVSGT